MRCRKDIHEGVRPICHTEGSIVVAIGSNNCYRVSKLHEGATTLTFK